MPHNSLLSRIQSWIRVPDRSAGGRTPAPFIVGAGRSGTTLLRLMLDAHPELAIPPETHFIHGVVKVCEGESDPRAAFIETLVTHRRWGDFQVEHGELGKRVASISPFNVGDGLRAFYALYAERFAKVKWGDKTPAYIQRMRLVHGVLPEARFIHLIRDGRDVALSAKDLWFGPNSIEEAAEHWRSIIDDARKQAPHLPYYIEVRYEDLVSDPETTLRKICRFIHLKWDPVMLAYHEKAEKRLSEIYRDLTDRGGTGGVRGEDRKAIHALAVKPPQIERIGRWRREMPAADRERFERIAGATLRELHYEIG